MSDFKVMICCLIPILIAITIYHYDKIEEKKAMELSGNLTQMVIQEGYFTSEDTAEFKKALAKLMKCDEEDIDISIGLPATREYNSLNYRIEIPTTNKFGGGSGKTKTILIQGRITPVVGGLIEEILKQREVMK